MAQSSKSHKHLQRLFSRVLILSATINVSACSKTDLITQQNISSTNNIVETIPANRFDLKQWKLTLPTDNNKDDKVDGINNTDLQNYAHEDFFHLDELGHMVFTAPNKGGTTKNSSNTRSELRYMSNVADRSINPNHPSNSFALASHPDANQFAAIGGKMEVTMHVDHAPRNSHKPKQKSSYALVIGQVHATKEKSEHINGFGYGNEPLKIIYKKWPNNRTGSIYWNYERNLKRGHPDKTDISYLVWGKPRENAADPGEQGIALGEDFSYTINIYKDTMFLTFESPRLGTQHFKINLADNVDANGKVDEKDNPQGYIRSGNYFKAGVYNQCRAAAKKNERQSRCPGTGDWAIDKPNGDYAQVSFSRLVVSEAEPQE